VCAREDGIRGSKDLRAEIGKFPNSTNERKKMSIKTLRKRIAVVAVSALTAGVFSVTSAPVANAVAVAVGDFNYTAAATQPGVCSVTNSDTAGSTVATITTGQTITIEDDSDITGGVYISVTGNATIASASSGFESITLTSATDSATTSSNTVTFRAGAVGTAKIFIAASSSAAAVDTLLLTIVAACAGDALSVGNSYFTATTEAEANDAEGSGWTQTAVDSSGSTRVANGSYGYIKIRLNDGYNADLATAGALVATTGASCVVGVVAASGTLAPGKTNTAVLASTGADDVVIVGQATADAPGACTVSLTFNGTSVGTKTLTIQGAPATVTVSDVTIGALGGNGHYRVTVADASGNLLPSKVITASSTNATNVAAIATGIITAVQATTGATTSAASGAGYGKTTEVTGANAITNTDSSLTKFTCSSSKSGVTSVTVRTPVDSVNSAYITSAPFTVACGGTLNTWAISMDKASYQPGEIATLTLSGKDSLGNAVATFTALSGVVYSFGGLTAITAPTTGDYFTSGAGIKTYQFSVGVSEGSFVGSFTTTGATDTAAKTVQYKVASSTATVSNADVLKSIVALIASINKQIQALQKLILKR